MGNLLTSGSNHGLDHGLDVDLGLIHELPCFPCLEVKGPHDCVSWGERLSLSYWHFWWSGPLLTSRWKSQKIDSPSKMKKHLCPPEPPSNKIGNRRWVNTRLGSCRESSCLRKECGHLMWPQRSNSRSLSAGVQLISLMYTSPFPVLSGWLAILTLHVSQVIECITRPWSHCGPAGLRGLSCLLHLSAWTMTIAYTAPQDEGCPRQTPCCPHLRKPCSQYRASNIVSVISVLITWVQV